LKDFWRDRLDAANRLKKICLSMIAVLSLLPLAAQAQNGPAKAQPAPAKGPTVEDKLAQSYRAMYDLKFQDAFKAADEAAALAPDDPLPSVAQAWVAFFRELDRLHALRSEVFTTDDGFNGRESYAWEPANKKIFDSALDRAEKLAQARLSRDPKDVRALLALSLSNGLRGDDMGIFTKKDLKALSYIKTATDFGERLLAQAPDSYDAYVPTGMGKYIIGRKSAPVRWVLRMGGYKGDEQEGMRELALAADHARYLAPFARILVAFEDVRKNNPAEARKKLEDLHQQFPNNPLFVEELGKLNRTSALLTRQGD
jgi:tetratricopeptide (TPR) repeat protein